MDEKDRRSLAHIRSLKHPDGRDSGPYRDCWTNVTSSEFGIVPGAQFLVELTDKEDVHVRVLNVDPRRPHVPGATVVPTIDAEVIT